jgi:ketosteroid isomerase-like protein
MRQWMLLTMLGWAAALSAENTPKATKETLMRRDDEFCAATKERRLEGWMSFFADDATGFPPGRDLVTGKAGLRQMYSKMFDDPEFTITWKPVKADIAASGDIGYTIGVSEINSKDKDGKRVTRKGKYLTVWKKQPDGSWKVAADLGN